MRQSPTCRLTSALAAFSVAIATTLASAQPCTPQWDWPSNQFPGVQSLVRVALAFNDGSGPKLAVGGSIFEAGGQPAEYIALWDGLKWSPLAGGTNGTVHALLWHDDGGGPALYVAGAFTQVFDSGGASMNANNIARWNGANWSTLGAGPANGANGGILSLASYWDGVSNALVAGGQFTSAGGASATRVARWNGSTWSNYGLGLGPAGIPTSPSVMALTVYSSPLGQTHLYAGGNFNDTGGTPIGRIARWSGSAWVTAGSPVTGLVQSLTVHDDGSGLKLYAGGTFTQIQGTGGPITVNRIARYNGSSWSAVGSGMSGEVSALLGIPLVALPGSPTSLLYAGGFFSTAGGQPASNVAVWNGSTWAAAGAGTSGPGVVSTIAMGLSALGVVGGIDIYVGGTFTDAGGQTVNHIVHYNGADYTPMFGQFHGTNGEVRAVEAFKDGASESLYAAGDFTTAGATGLGFGHIARWNGATWSDVDGGVNGPARALAVHDDGGGDALYVGGQFNFAGFASSIFTGPVARWDGSSWSALGGSLDGQVDQLVSVDELAGPRLYASGLLTVSGVPGFRLAVWNGFSWTGIAGGGAPGDLQLQQVYAMTSRLNIIGRVLMVAGDFTSTAPGLSGIYVARWTGTSFQPHPGPFNGVPTSIISWDNGGAQEQMVVAGNFTSVAGAAVQGAAQWTPAGWTPLGAVSNGEIRSFAAFDDGAGAKLYSGGSFTALGAPVNRVARYDGGWGPLGTGIEGAGLPVVLDLCVWNRPTGATLVVGGRFTSANGQPVRNLASWKGCLIPVGSCPADFNGDLVVNGIDLATLLASWTGPATYAPCPRYLPADLNHDCRVNGLDLGPLLAAWGPCP